MMMMVVNVVIEVVVVVMIMASFLPIIAWSKVDGTLEQRFRISL
jgi:hypothetical protein